VIIAEQSAERGIPVFFGRHVLFCNGLTMFRLSDVLSALRKKRDSRSLRQRRRNTAPSYAASASERLEPRQMLTVFEWGGNIDGNWSNPANWSPTFVPAAGDDVVINADDGVPFEINLDTNSVINSLTINSPNATLNITNRTLTINQASVIDSGVLELNGSLGRIQGLGTLTNNSRLEANGSSVTITAPFVQNGVLAIGDADSGTAARLQTNSFTNTGTIQLGNANSTTAHLVVSAGQTLTNAASGTVNVQAAAGGSGEISGAFINEGVLDVDSDFEFDGQNVTVVNRGNFDVAAGTSTLIGDTSVLTFVQESGTLTLNGSLSTDSDTFRFTGGTVDGTALPVVNRGTLDLDPNAGAIDLIVTQNVTLAGDIGTGQTVRIQNDDFREGELLSTAGFTNSGSILFEADPDSANERQSKLTVTSGSLINAAGGVIETNGNIGRISVPVVQNAGRIEVDTAVTLFVDELTNTGTVLAGTDLDFTKAGAVLDNTGDLVVEAGATLSFGNSTTFLQNSGTLQIVGEFATSGDFVLNGGNITGNAPVVEFGDISYGIGPLNPATVVVRGTVEAETDVPVGQTVIVEPAGQNAQLRVPAGFRNSGTIRLEQAAGSASTALIQAGGGGDDFVNTPDGILELLSGAETPLFVGLLSNQGTLNIGTDVVFNRSGGQLVNEGLINVPEDHSFSLLSAGFGGTAPDLLHQNGTLAVDGQLTVGGLLKSAGGNFTGSGNLLVANGDLEIEAGNTNPFEISLRGSVDLLGDLAAGQTVHIETTGTAQTTVQLEDGFVNSGLITVDAIDSATGTARLSSSGGTIANAATGVIDVNVGGSFAMSVAEFSNQGRFDLNRDLLSSSSINIVNSGQFDVQADASLTLQGFSSTRPTFEQAAGTLNVDGSFVVNNANLRFDNGTVQGTNNPTFTSGTLTIDAGNQNIAAFDVHGTTTLDSGLNVNQTINLQPQTSSAISLRVPNDFHNAGTINFDTREGTTGTATLQTITSNTGIITNEGVVQIQEGSHRILSGEFINSGTTTVSGAVEFSGDILVSNTGLLNVLPEGTVTLGNSSTASNPVFNQDANGALTNDGTFVSDNSGTFSFNGGTINGTQPVILKSSDLNIADGNSAAAHFRFEGNSSLNNDLASGQRIDIAPVGPITSVVTVSNPFTNAGEIVFDISDSTGGASRLRTQSIATGTVTNASTGVIRGNGEVEASLLSNNGTLSPGASAGTLTIDADLQLGAGSMITMELGGVTGGTQFDRLNAEHAVSLGGELALSVIDGFLPTAGQTFEIISFPSASGDFALVSGTDIGNGALLEKALNADNVTLQVISPPGLTIGDVTVTEGDAGTLNAVFTVQLEPTGNPVSVDFATEELTALAGEDFQATSGTLNFAAGETSKTIEVPITGDLRDEDDETFRVILSNAVNAAIPDPEGIGTIQDNNDSQPQISFAVDTSSVAEDGGSLFVVVQLDRPSGVSTSVDFSVTGGSAEQGTDFTLASGTLNFAADQVSQQIEIPITDDALVEDPETIEITLTSPSRLALGPTTLHTVTITDNDFHPDLVIDAANAPASADRGAAFNIEWLVRNAGQGETSGLFSDRVYLSADQTIDGNDTVLITRSAAADLPLTPGESYTATESVTLPAVDPGNYFLIFESDTSGQLTEDSESNNTRTAPLEILGADLIVSQLNAAATASAGTIVPIDFDTTNQGPGRAESLPLNRVFFSDDAVLDDSDVAVFSAFGTALNAGDTLSQSGSINIPEVLPGTYFLIVSADHTNAQVELNEENNLLVQPITVQVPDLTVTTAAAPASADVGTQVGISFTVVNQGTGATTASRLDRVYLSEDGTVDATDRILLTRSSFSDGSLAPGEATVASEDISIPTEIAAGDYFLLFVTDDIQREFESDESNNLLQRPIRIDGADLIIESITAPATAQFGDEVELSWTVRNIGTQTATADIFDQLRLTAQPDGSGSSVPLLFEDAGDSVPLAPGETYTRTLTATLPLNRSSSPGTFFIFGRTDATSQIAELNEQNNTSSVAIDLSLPPLPDIVVSDITIPVNAAQTGDQLEIEWTVTNNGTAPAVGPWQTSLTLIDAADTVAARFLSSIDFNGTLQPGESIVRRQTVTLPEEPGFEGAARVVVHVDATGQVFEHAGDDNNRFLDNDAFELAIREFPNLIVSEIVVPPTAVAGETTEIQFTVSNIGNAPTSAPFWSDQVFLSLDQTFDPNPGEDRGADILLGTANNVSFLNPGESYTNSLEVTLPDGLDDDFFVFVFTDRSNRVNERGGEDDNLAISSPLTITLPPAPDLQITDIQAPLNIFSEEEFTVTWTVTNTGDGPTESDRISDRILLSADDQLGGNDFVIGSQTHFGILQPGESYTESRTVTAPVGFQGLDLFLLVETDFTGQVFEHANELNNQSSRPINAFLAPSPDLQVEDFTLTQTARSGVPVSLEYTAANRGLGITPNTFWFDTVFLSADTTLDASDLILDRVRHNGAVSVDETYTETASGILPNGLAGDFFVIVRSDSEDQVFESIFEVNNVGVSSQTISVQSQPADLVVTDISLPATAVTGQTISVEWTIENRGIGDTITDSLVDRIFISTDDIIGNADDISLGRLNHRTLLNPGESLTASQLVTIPHELQGTVKAYVRTDADFVVFESDESNNTSNLINLDITPQLADLTITSLDSVSAPPAGNVFVKDDILQVQWTGLNAGTGSTNRNAWRDDVFLSQDTIFDPSDIRLGTAFRGGSLAAGQAYSLNGSFRIPNVDGDFHLIIRSDRNNDILESDEDNNTFVASDTTITIQQTNDILPDLTVPLVDAPATAVSGQQMDVSWTIQNLVGSIGNLQWFSTVFLSRDEVLDSSDIVLRSVPTTGPLEAGESVQVSTTVDLPRGLSGDFFVFVKTDTATTRSVREANEDNNTQHDIQAVSVQLLPPSDLVVGAIPVPANAVPGQDISITYTVTNEGNDTAIGRWSDTLFLSTDDVFDSSDIVLGEVPHVGDLAPGESYTETLTAPLPGISPGEHFVIVRSDIRNQVPEISEQNNIRASVDQVDIAIPELAMGVPAAGQLGNGDFSYFRVDVKAGDTLRIQLDSESASAFNQLFVSFDRVPTRADFDFTANDDLGPDQEVLIPVTRQGTYFILANGAFVDQASDVPFTLTASVPSFEVFSTSVTQGANRGPVTLTLRGAELTPTTAASLVADDGTRIDATEFRWVNQSEVWATFDLQDAQLGDYDIHVTDDGQSSTLTDSFTVTDGPEGELRINVRSPASVGGGIANTSPRWLVQVEYENVGQTDVPAALLNLNSAGARIQIPGLDGTFVQNFQFLAINRTGSGPAGILQPGSSNTFTFLAEAGGEGGAPAPDGQLGTIATFTAAEPDVTTQDIIEPVLDAFVQDAALRQLLLDQLLTSIGPQPEDLITALSQNATHLSQLGRHTSDLLELVSFEMLQLSLDSLLVTPVSDTDVVAPAPGPQLLFERVFNSTAARLGQAGVLGQGWTHTWDWTLDTDASNNIRINAPDGVLTYRPDGNGGFLSGKGDLGTLAIEGSRFVHTDRSGDRRIFSLDGTLLRLEGSQGQQISLAYVDRRLTDIQHSNGQTIQLSYDANGRLTRVLDHAGRAIDYTYDASGQFLQQVDSPHGTSTYTYDSVADSPSEGLVQSLTQSDGIQRRFEYDLLGRVTAEEIGSTDVVRTEYSYDDAGQITITDAAGNTRDLLMFATGSVGHLYNQFGDAVVFSETLNRTLDEFILPGGIVYDIGSDADGNVSEIVDPNGARARYQYNPSGDLLSVTDPTGQSVAFAYDGNGNRLSATFADGSQHTATYDAVGLLNSYTDRAGRAQQISYTPAGQIQQIDYADGSSVSYTYDTRGNLLTATDSTGTVTYTWNNADQLTSVTHANGSTLSFEYDGRGRRIATTDHTGFTTRYAFDDLNRLTSVTDENDVVLISYQYDAVGRLLREDNANGTFTTYTYDAAGRITSRHNHAPDGSISSRFDYVWNELGQQESVTTTAGRFDYEYDLLGQLVEVTTPDGQEIRYEYDAAGNRTAEIVDGVRKDYVLDNLGRAVQVGNAFYTYDDNGFLTEIDDGGSLTRYDYDVRGRLIRIETDTDVTQYEYDALDNRIAEIVNGVRTDFLIDPFGAGNLIGEFDAAGAAKSRHVFGNGLVASVDSAGDSSFFEFDGLGNTAGISSATGINVASYLYLPFGETLVSAESSPNRFRFGGERGGTTDAAGSITSGQDTFRPQDGSFISPAARQTSGQPGSVLRGRTFSHNNPTSFATAANRNSDGLRSQGRAGTPGRPSVNSDTRNPGQTPQVSAPDAIGALLSQFTSTTPLGDHPGTTDSQPVVGGLASDAQQRIDELRGIHQDIRDTTIEFGYELGKTAIKAGIAAVYGPKAVIKNTFNPFSLDLGFDDQGILGDIQDSINNIVRQIARRPLKLAMAVDTFIRFSRDPNDITGPTGFGPEHWVPATERLPFTIRFENLSDASAPAQRVLITTKIDRDIDIRTLRLGDFGFGDFIFDVDENSATFIDETFDFTDSKGILVDVEAAADPRDNTVTWLLTALDPVTGLLPTDPAVGFLPPNNADRDGEGFVTYSIAADPDTPSGTEIDSQATIIFDNNPPLDTNVFVNTIDSSRPASQVNPLPGLSSDFFEVSWTGQDDANGSGIAAYDIFVSVDDGPFQPFLLATSATSAPFRAELEHSYRFFSVAIDNAGNRELSPVPFDAFTRATADADDVTAPVSQPSAERNATSLEFDINVTASDPAGPDNEPVSGIQRVDVFVAIDEGPFTLHTSLQPGESSFTFQAESNHIYWFRTVAVDNAGNVEDKPVVPEATVFVGDFAAPETSVSAIEVSDTGNMQLTLNGTDSGGSGLAAFDVFVVIDDGAPTLFATVDAGEPDANGNYTATTSFQGIADGAEHTYAFFTVGKDGNDNTEAAPGTADETLTAVFQPPVTIEATGIDVQEGARQRSFVRFVDIDFTSSDNLQDLIDSAAITLERFDLNAANVTVGTGQQVDLSNTLFTTSNNRIRLDFGDQGIGGNRNDRTGDGMYRILLDTNGDGLADQTFEFFRIFGDADGDGDADLRDVVRVLQGFRRNRTPSEYDMNGDGNVNVLDLLFTARESLFGKRLDEDLFELLDD
jgi:YD repeat-containing protein